MPPGFDVVTTHEGSTTTVALVGEIDLVTAVRLDRELVAALDAAPQWLRLDLLELSFMDTSGVAILL